MEMFEATWTSLLLFIRSSREGLNGSYIMIRYKTLINIFFAHDQLNYARMSPLYLASVFDLESNDPAEAVVQRCS